MLALSRVVGESIIIDGKVKVQIVGVRYNKVRLGITAPKSVRVDREEIHLRRNLDTDKDDEIEADLEMLRRGKRSTF